MDDLLTAITARWTLLPGATEVEVADDAVVLVRGRTIEAVLRGQPPPAGAARRIDLPTAVLLPGFVNLHNHALNGPIFRGIVDDIPNRSDDSPIDGDNLVHSLLLPLGDLTSTVLSDEQLRSIFRLAIVELLRSGTTTVLDMPRAQHTGLLEAARELGIRLHAAPYIFSAPSRGVDALGRPRYEDIDENASLAAAIAVAERFDEGLEGRIRVGFGPHATDTCSPRLLRRIAAAARERGAVISIHVAQSRAEVDVVRQRYGCTPVEYLADAGVLGERTVVAHGVYVEDSDLELLRATGATVAHCPLTFARSGVRVSFDRFHRAGVRTGIGTDAYSFDHLAELRAAGFQAKLDAGDGGAATAPTLLAAATSVGGAVLDPRLGRVESGFLADLVAFDLSAAHLQPVRDPIRNLVWNATPSDLAWSMIDGVVVAEGGGLSGVPEARIVSEAAEAVARLWSAAEERGVLTPRESSVR